MAGAALPQGLVTCIHVAFLAGEVTSVAVKTVGFAFAFAFADDDRPCWTGWSRGTGYGNRSEFLRAAMKVMAAEERAERLRSLQGRAHAQSGRIFPSTHAMTTLGSSLARRTMVVGVSGRVFGS
jgi:hypothetical protein